MWRCWQRWLQLVVRDTDTPEERRRKTFVFTMVCAIIAVGFVNLGQLGRVHIGHLAEFIAWTICEVAVVGMFIWLVVFKSLSLRVLGLWLSVLGSAAIVFDWSSGAAMAAFRPWNWIILLMDISLAFGVPRIHQHTVLSLTTSYLLVTFAESVWRLGVWDTALTAEAKERALEYCDCSDPPCARPLVMSIPPYLCMFVVLFGDFLATRGFADGLRSEQSMTVAAVRLSERVAALLADYATADARQVVREEGDALPIALLDSYTRLLDNLDRYRAFLPDSVLFVERSESGHSLLGSPSHPWCSVNPPESPEVRDVAVSFTDIQSSTELWEQHPQAMYEALRMHNKAMRKTFATCGGYEVKTIGDAFMVAFDAAAGALKFGLKVQTELLRQSWPEKLLTHPLCRPVQGNDGLLWNGLRVRIAAHYGPARLEPNPVTGRLDFFGPTVNTAGRMERVVNPGGMVAVTSSVIDGLGPSGLEGVGSPAAFKLGNKEFKGVKGEVEVWALVPRPLEQRLTLLGEPPQPRALLSIDLCSTPRGSPLQKPENSTAERRSEVSYKLPTPRTMFVEASGSLRPMHYTVGTCAVVRLALSQSEPLPMSVTNFTFHAAMAADQAQGVVETVLSATVTISWNASLHCVDHAAGCRGFMASMLRADIHLGAASGGLLNGTVTAGRRSFATIVGGCVELAAALAEEAERCGDSALATGAVADDLIRIGAAFCAQLWQTPGESAMVVWEVDEARLCNKWDLHDSGDEMQQMTGGSAEDVTAFFHQACAEAPRSDRQLAVLGKLEAQGLRSAAQQRLMERIRGGWVRTRPLPPLWEIDPVGRQISRFGWG